MARLEDLTRGASVGGILPGAAVMVLDAQWHGADVLELVYRDPTGRHGSELLFRDREPSLDVIEAGRAWSFDGDGRLLKLAAEAHRIRLAYLFDPLLAIHTSLIDPLPHQITAVYEAMLARQPLRFLLADDPGAGKTIMAGLLIKELMARGDLRRCLVVCPGALAEQWQDELDRKFQLPFDILTNDKLEAARTGNWFLETSLAIARLDKLSRDDDVQDKLRQVDWDLVVCDEAHKMSATFFGSEIKYTKRYRLGELLSESCRHFVLMTATPHNGKEEDFQLFLALLDGDRFEGRFRDGVHTIDASDLMRRMVKEDILTFEGKRLFPERRAETVSYPLSDLEARLYRAVTEYVREEFNRAEALQNDGRRGTIGFALTVLQRRLASSPEAILQSLRRRRERLEKRLRESALLQRGASLEIGQPAVALSAEELEDLEDAPGDELELAEEALVDQATASRTIAELEAEISTLSRLESLAREVRASSTDAKWEQLRDLLQNATGMFDAHGHRRKLVIFTEHRDTLDYLRGRIETLIGRPEAIVTIKGGMGRDERRKVEAAFTQLKDIEILIATDAAGEGINLQRAHLMVNYDLPWNPNRIEQRFGRIHRIGQSEVCHLWNLVAKDTREGEVFLTLLQKLEREQEALQGRVFDVLGKLTFDNRPLRDLLIEAIRYGDRDDVRARLNETVEGALDHDHLTELIAERQLVHDSLDTRKVQAIREEMERAEARRLQPHFISSFFQEAFAHLGGTLRARETGRFEIGHVPAPLRERDRLIGRGDPILRSYERVTFRKDLIRVPGKPPAAFVCPGHPLLDVTADLILERHQGLLRRGGLLIDPNDTRESPRALVLLEHAVHDAGTTRSGERRTISRRMLFVEIDPGGRVGHAGPAPYLDYEPLAETDRHKVQDLIDQPWLSRDLERTALGFAIRELAQPHLEEIRKAREERSAKVEAAVHERLTKEIHYWHHRAYDIELKEEAGRTPKLNSGKARERAAELEDRLQTRLQEIARERQVSAAAPLVIGAALVIPAGLLARFGVEPTTPSMLGGASVEIERRAIDAVMAAERALGFEPIDVGDERRGYDVESRHGDGRLRFIEVKGRAEGADTVVLTRNEVLVGLNKPDDFILALVQVADGRAAEPRYVRRPFEREPDTGATAVVYKLKELLARATAPS